MKGFPGQLPQAVQRARTSVFLLVLLWHLFIAGENRKLYVVSVKHVRKKSSSALGPATWTPLLRVLISVTLGTKDEMRQACQVSQNDDGDEDMSHAPWLLLSTIANYNNYDSCEHRARPGPRESDRLDCGCALERKSSKKKASRAPFCRCWTRTTAARISRLEGAVPCSVDDSAPQGSVASCSRHENVKFLL